MLVLLWIGFLLLSFLFRSGLGIWVSDSLLFFLQLVGRMSRRPTAGKPGAEVAPAGGVGCSPGKTWAAPLEKNGMEVRELPEESRPFFIDTRTRTVFVLLKRTGSLQGKEAGHG